MLQPRHWLIALSGNIIWNFIYSSVHVCSILHLPPVSLSLSLSLYISLKRGTNSTRNSAYVDVFVHLPRLSLSLDFFHFDFVTGISRRFLFLLRLWRLFRRRVIPSPYAIPSSDIPAAMLSASLFTRLFLFSTSVFFNPPLAFLIMCV